MKLPEGWKEIELGEIFEFQTKSKIKAGEGNEEGKYKFFTSSDKQSKFIDKYNHDGEFLIFATGGHAGVHYCNEKFATSTDCFIVKIIDKIMTKYIYYYLSGQISLLEDGFKGAGLKHLSKGYLGQIKISYPEDKKIQKQIVSILEKAEKLKQNREDSDKLAKEYLQSVFYEMFGNLGKNDQNWVVKKLDEISIKITDGEHTLPKKVERGKPLLMAGNVRDIYLDLSNISYISEEDHTKLQKRCKPEENDILLVCVGATIGRVAIVPKMESFSLVRSVALIKPNKKEINSLYLLYCLKNKSIQKQLLSKINTVAQAGLYLNQIKILQIPLPPLPLQQKFSSIVEHFEKIKEKQKQSKEEIDNLFNSLMQKAFNGELMR